MFHVYVLRSETTGKRYTGSCKDLQARLTQHNRGQSKATRHGKPWVLLHSEVFATRAEALSREQYFKSGQGRSTLDRLLREQHPS